MKKAILKKYEKEIFQKVRKVIFANPFSEERLEADIEISGLPKSASQEDRIKAIRNNVFLALSKIVPDRRDDIRMYRGDDRELFEYGVLFHIYHNFRSHFDKLIIQQVKDGETPCRVDFAEDAIGMALECGFKKDVALRYFGMSYQMRRAFYFINQIIGCSQCMRDLRRNLWNNIFTYNIGIYNEYLWNRMEDFSTLLLGETGTGKGMAAGAIGRSGFIPYDEKQNRFCESFTKVFISLNLSQFPEQLVESELFGHQKGSFTGAVETHKGIFSLCSPYGSIFLDEIGEVSIPVQIKLLQVLQERFFSPVGSHQKNQFRGRVIAATNHSLQSLRTKGYFRDDFYYRLCSDIISVPPLRQRIEQDQNELIDLLANTIERILGNYSAKLLEDTLCAINKQLPDNYSWPGNVRELEQAARRILLTRHYQGDMRDVVSDKQSRLHRGIDDGSLNAQELLTSYCAVLYQRHGTFEEVARITKLDRRTVKKYVLAARQ